jgi:DNA-binding MarR family transcriptional regulator
LPQLRSESGDPFEVADRLHSAAIHLLRRLRVQDTAMGIGPAQASALSVLVFAGPMTLSELARVEQVRPPTMSRVVRALRRAGLVTGERGRDDRRSLRLRPTPKGVRTLQAGRRRRVSRLANVLRSLSAEELRRLGSMARVMEEMMTKL